MIDLRVKNSAPSIDPQWSAHAQVRALSVETTRKLMTLLHLSDVQILSASRNRIARSLFSLL